jgi:Asp-tRNA(Asn)/Glu-tRNA(Gln) amidotransferase A subunit family amidase
VSVKDNIDIRGIKTSLSSRSWNSLYGEVLETAPAIQRLVDLGAVIIGKTRLSQFAETEYPTADWVDYHCPFNPRGDGYLTPEGSSSGAGAATAAYNSLDLSIATDSKSPSRLCLNVYKQIRAASGSIREPSAKQGLFAIRPTFGSQSMNGIFPLARSDLLSLVYSWQNVDKC